MSLWSSLWSVEAGWGWLAAGAPAPPATIALGAALGLCLGSFLNVVIHRLPHEESIVWPASRCPACGHALAPWENLPLVSFVLLAARCRSCRAPIAWRYPLVEALGGATVALAAWRFGLGPATVGAAVFALFLIAVAWIDAEHRVIPDELSAGLFAFGLWCRGWSTTGLVQAGAGAVAGVLVLGGLAWAYRRVRGVDGLGGGDVKLAAGLGAFLGLPGLVVTLMLASLVGSVVGLALMARGKAHGQTALPFGTFLAGAAAAALVLGPAWWRAYLTLLAPTP